MDGQYRFRFIFFRFIIANFVKLKPVRDLRKGRSDQKIKKQKLKGNRITFLIILGARHSGFYVF